MERPTVVDRTRPADGRRLLRAVLFDLDGVLETDDGIEEGAAGLLSELDAQAISWAIITNDIRESAYDRHRLLLRAGARLEPHLWLTPYDALEAALANASCQYPRFFGAPPPASHAWLRTPPALADSIVLGDVRGAQDEFETCSALASEGVPIFALQKNPHLMAVGQQVVDVGGYVATWEQRLGRKAQIVGKPAPSLYSLALHRLGAAPSEAVMISDSFHNDLCGALGVGIAGILVSKYALKDEIVAARKSCLVAADLTMVRSLLLR